MATASSTHSWVRCTLASSTIGPTSVAASAGSPTLSAAEAATNLPMNSSQTSSWTNIRWTLMHVWPEYATPPLTARLTAQSMFAERSTIRPRRCRPARA